MRTKTWLRRLARFLLPCICLAFIPLAKAQNLAWEQTKYFQYNIYNVTVAKVSPGSWRVRLIFSVSNEEAGGIRWDIKTAPPFQTNPANMTWDIGWDGKEFTNTGSANSALAPIVNKKLGDGAALPVQVRGLQVPAPDPPQVPSATDAMPCRDATDCPGLDPQFLDKSYFVEKVVTPVPSTVRTGRVAIEGRLVCKDTDLNPFLGCPTSPPYPNIPVRSATADFVFAESKGAMVDNPRRKIVDIAKCKGCHDDGKHGDSVVPRLSLHGANRNENLDLCVVCHNPNQTDVPYRFASPTDPRIGAAETAINFGPMVHSIHAGGFRKTPFVVVGFNSSVHDFSGVRFPAELRKSCLKCHVETNGKGTFELPLSSSVLGTTIKTQSTYQVAAGESRTIDVDPANDVKISPTAAVCSACHDNAEVRSHMIRTGGASFSTTQAQIGKTVIERCASCHGPGKTEDVRKAHELGGSRESRERDD